MKKNISINLQGLIFHIEEDGYDILQQYLQDVKTHFSSYRGHEEIVADIEGRIAELFAARTSSLKQVVTLDDVLAVTTKMGRVQEFQQVGALDDDDDAADVNSYGQPVGAGTYAGSGSGSTAASDAAADNEPRRLYRDMANRKIAGVAAGLGRYFAVNPLWIRVCFIVLALFKPLVRRVVWDDDFDFNFSFGGLSVLVYIILWIALPKRYDVPPTPVNTDPTFKKLYRDTDAGKVGGVSAGLAAYFKVDVVLVRILFIVFAFAGGFAIPLYIVLWILVPEAKTVTDKMRMRGNAVTLSSLDESVRNQAYEAGMVGGNRPVGTFLEDSARNLRPAVNFIGTFIRWALAAFLIVIGFSLLLGLAVVLGVALGLIPESNHVVMGDVPAYTVLAGVPWWLIVSGFLTAGIPVLVLLLLGIGLLTRGRVMNRTVSLSLLGLWLLGIVGSVMGGVRLAHEFEEQGSVVLDRPLGGIPYETITLDAHDTDRGWQMHPELSLGAADSGAVVRLVEERYAYGPTESAAMNTARTSIAYRATLRDSTVVLDDRFAFQPGAVFRKQRLDLTLMLPRDKRYRLTSDFLHLLDSDDFVNDKRPDNATRHLYRLRGAQLECLDCTPDEMQADDDEEAADGDFDMSVNGERVHISMDGDEDADEDEDLTSFSTSPEDYGSGSRNFNETGFNRLDVSGAYRVVVYRSEQFRVRATGRERDLKELEVRRSGNELTVRPRRRGIFGSSWNGREPRILLEIEMPALEALDLSGAVQAKVNDFNTQGDMRVEQSGASRLDFQSECRTLRLDVSGASRTALRGRSTSLRLDASGASRVQGPNFATDNADVELSGVSKARLRVERELKAEVNGASELLYSGNPSARTKDSGAGRVRRVE